MDLSRSEYPALLGSVQPGQAITILEDRVRSIGKINSDIADWLSERRRVEEVYVQGLRKLAGRRPHDASNDLGVFQSSWQTMLNSTDSLAQSHATLAQKIDADVERPLREYQSKNKEMQAMTTIQGNLVSLCRDLESTQKKAEKPKSGKPWASKTANATSGVEHALQQWESQAPYVFERLQALDENRVNHLREVLTQLQTHELDQIEKCRIAAETCLNTLLAVDTTDEISTFVARYSSGVPSLMSRQRGPMTTDTVPANPPHIVASPDDGASERSSVSVGALRSGLPTVQEQRRTPFGALKRIGTVMSRRRQTLKPSDSALSPEKRSRPNLNPLRRGTGSRNMQAIPSPEASVVNLNPLSPRREPASPLPRASTTCETSQAPQAPPAIRKIFDHRNGNDVPLPPGRSASLPITNGSSQSQEKQSIAPPEKQPEGERDDDGLSVPPSATDEITRAQQEAGSIESEPHFKLDIRSEPIQEEDSDAQSALSNVANTLRAQAQQVATPRKPTVNRGRRDVRNTIFVPSPQTPEISSFGDSSILSGSPPSNAKSNPLSPDLGHSLDAQSIRSSHSVSSMVNASIKHSDMHQPGLNASIVETVSAWFSQSEVTRAVVIGELALVHNPGGTGNPSGFENIRLENFPVLEKVAPNPSFITQIQSRSGDYSVNLSSISRTSVAFKYQVHLEESNLAAHAPMALAPVWKIEPAQTSVIVNYSFNPSFVSPIKRSVNLKNVTVIVTIENAKALSCLSKPIGTFSKERSMIYWKLGDVHLDGYAESPQKLLARFTTESEAKPGSVEVRWEISGEDAVGVGSGLSLSQVARSGGDGGSDPFADQGTGVGSMGAWKEVAVIRKIGSGRYTAT